MSQLELAIEKIEKARLEFSSHHIVNIVAVSKYTDTEAIRSLYCEGQRAFGESRVQDLETKSALLDELPLDWHFIGRLQTNKINKLLEIYPSLIHSVDSYDTAVEIDKRAAVRSIKPKILLQINSAREDSKAGLMPEASVDEYLKIKQLSNVEPRGVMSIGAHVEELETIKKSFETTYKIFDELKKYGATTCSMGMSSDYELAIRCGSNCVRLGSVLF